MKLGRPDDSVFLVNNITIENVNQYKYLGVIMTSDLSTTKDVEQVQNTYYRSVGMLNTQFHSVKLGIKLKLLITICLPMYGLNL